MADCDSQDLGDLRVEQVKVPSSSGQKAQFFSRRERTSGSSKIKGLFIRGPIPLWWWRRACRLKRKNALVVASALWFLSGLRRRKNDLKLTSSILEKFGLTDRSAKSRGLEALENGGLIRVQRQGKRNPRVTILDDNEEAVLSRQDT